MRFSVSKRQARRLTMALVYVALNLVIDIAYGVIDPRVGIEG